MQNSKTIPCGNAGRSSPAAASMKGNPFVSINTIVYSPLMARLHSVFRHDRDDKERKWYPPS